MGGRILKEANITKDKVREGFSFYTDNDAELAEQERKKIEYLEARMDYSRPETILKIYDKAIHDRVFKTPVGLFYLKNIQDYLLNQETIEPEQIAPIPLFQVYGREIRKEQNVVRNRVQTSDKKRKPSALSVSVILNILLAIAIISMFVISLNAEQPNILNYKRVITDQYASWEQELTEREQTVREKERELLREAE